MSDATDTQEPDAMVVPAAPVVTPARNNPVMPMVVGGVIAAVIGFAAAQVVPIGWRSADTSTIQAQLDGQTAELASVKAALAKASQPDAALTDRLTAVEAALGAMTPAPDLAPLISRLDALEQTVTGLQARPASMGQIDPSALNALQAQIDALKSGGIVATATAEVSAALDAKLAEAEARVGAIKADADTLAAATLKRAALHQIVAALDSGAPYASAIADLGDTTLSPVLVDHAASGLPTLQSLRQGFPDAARSALDAALKATMGTSWTDRATAFLLGQTGARSLTPREGSDPDAVLSRAEAALAAGDLSAALSEITSLPSEGQSAMADWLAQAQLRQAAAVEVQALLTASAL